jgi:hypothetical protein
MFTDAGHLGLFSGAIGATGEQLGDFRHAFRAWPRSRRPSACTNS